jgi:mannosyltransferase OCH1-like enzyme
VRTPKLIHQTWKTREVPPQFAANIATIERHQPDYERRLWTDDAIDAFVRQRAPEFADAYRSFRKRIEQIDFARYLILHECGGAYFDLDMVSIRSIDALVATNRIVLGLECAEHTQQFRPRPARVISNAVMISPPGEPFWLELMRHIAAHYDDARPLWQRGPVYRTGPLALTAFVDSLSHDAAARVSVLPASAFCPMSDHWNDGHIVDGYDSITAECQSFDDTYAIHLWSHSWLPPWVQAFNQYKRRIISSVATTARSRGRSRRRAPC